MKSLYSYCINENAQAQVIHEICSWLETTQETYKKMETIAKAMSRKEPETISFEHLAASSVVDKLAAEGAKLAKLRLDTSTRKELRKYIAGIILRMYDDETSFIVLDWEPDDWNYNDLTW